VVGKVAENRVTKHDMTRLLGYHLTGDDKFPRSHQVDVSGIPERFASLGDAGVEGLDQFAGGTLDLRLEFHASCGGYVEFV
jgi:hypothetical protein